MTTTAAPQSKTSIFEDFIDIFYAPSEVFTRRRDGRFGIALLFLTIVLAVLYFMSSGLLSAVFEVEYATQMEKLLRDNPSMTADQLEKGRGFAEMAQKIFMVIGIPIAVLLTGVVLWVAGKLFGAVQTFALAMMVATYAFFPRIVEGILNGIQTLLLDATTIDSRYDITFSAARFLDAKSVSPIVLALAGRIDLFVIWSLVLVAIGLHITGNIPKNKAAMAAGVVWLGGTLFALSSAMRM